MEIDQGALAVARKAINDELRKTIWRRFWREKEEVRAQVLAKIIIADRLEANLPDYPYSYYRKAAEYHLIDMLKKLRTEGNSVEIKKAVEEEEREANRHECDENDDNREPGERGLSCPLPDKQAEKEDRKLTHVPDLVSSVARRSTYVIPYLPPPRPGSAVAFLSEYSHRRDRADERAKKRERVWLAADLVLTPIEKEVMRLRYREDWTLKMIGAELGRATSTIDYWVTSAEEKLRQFLGNWESESDSSSGLEEQ